MNHTKRGFNRVVLCLFGIVLLGVGGLLIAATTVPAVGEAWQQIGSDSREWVSNSEKSTVIADGPATWLGVGVVAALAVLIILLVVLAARAVRGRRRMLLHGTSAHNDLGRIAVTEGFAAEALLGALTSRDEILAAKVTANDIQGTPVLHVSVTPRQNTSPLHVARTVDQLVTNLATLTGVETAAFTSVHSGLRAALARDQQRVS